MKRRLWKLLEGDNGVIPILDTIILFVVAKIYGMVLMSRLHKIVYILKEKYGVSLRLGYQTSPINLLRRLEG
ncbi:MAG: hypothetical protein LZ167_08010 [Thaumarchaeota archaeon]|jgi:hypothetical protein|nr:hypothetical protein [Candidatus Geocrenenecus arthurdayi]